MNLYPQKDRTIYNPKLRKSSSKQSHLCSTCSILKREVRQLRELHQKLMKEIKILAAYIPRQIEIIISKIGTTANLPRKDKSSSSLKQPIATRKMSHDPQDSLESKQPFQSKLKVEDGIIKESIYKELKALKVLESKQKDLRIANEKHQSLRKSFSKESINSNHAPKMRKLQSSSKISQKSSPSSFMDNIIIKRELSDQNQLINSPKFGKINEDLKFQAKIRYSLYDSKSKRSDLEGNLQKAQLKCPNGHQCYKGETMNHLPHGIGTLVNCCSKIPFKVNPKTLKYTGSFKFGQFQGKGVLLCKDNVKFQGSFSKGMRHGEGIIFLEGASEKGFWQQDKLVSFV